MGGFRKYWPDGVRPVEPPPSSGCDEPMRVAPEDTAPIGCRWWAPFLEAQLHI